LVDDDLLRFDFYADRLLTVEELQTIEENINILIHQSLSVVCKEMSLKEAQEL
jgi:alanyl-tRNA synthetase